MLKVNRQIKRAIIAIMFTLYAVLHILLTGIKQMVNSNNIDLQLLVWTEGSNTDNTRSYFHPEKNL